MALERGNFISLPSDLCHCCCYWQQDEISNNLHWLKSDLQLAASKSTYASFSKCLMEWPAKSSCIHFQWPSQVVRDPIMTWNVKLESCRGPDPAISPDLCCAAGLFTVITCIYSFWKWLVLFSIVKINGEQVFLLFGNFQVLNMSALFHSE